jgi:hypothetical protein
MRFTWPLLLSLVVAACQGDVTTPFPPGLEPLEENTVPDTDDRSEVLRTKSVSGGFIRVHGRGYVHASPAAVWAAALMPEAMIARCSTDKQEITLDTEPEYEFSFLVHYTRHEILTIEWDDQWRYGIVDGTAEEPRIGMIRHQKVQGSDFIELSAGSVQVLATDDPDISELAFVEHLDAIAGSASDVTAGMQSNYDALVELAHGRPIPPCR